MTTNKKEIGIISAALVIVAIIASAYYLMGGSPTTGLGGANGNGGSSAGQGAGSGYGAAPVPMTQVTRTAQPLAGGAQIAIPGKGETGLPAGVAAPSVVGPGSPAGTTSFRAFNVTLSHGVFSPSTIIVKSDDTVHINLTATGGSYDFVQPDYGLALAIPAGQTKVVQFDATVAGKFTFYCASCGGLSSGPRGYIEVVP